METSKSENLAIDPRQVLRGILWVVAGLAIISLSLRAGEAFGGIHPTRKFDLDSEGNIPNFISAALLAMASGLFWIIGNLKKSSEDRLALGWKALSVLWGLFALDEAAAIHETLNGFFSRRFHVSGFFHWGWVLAGFPFALLVGLAMARFARRLPFGTSKNMLASILIYFGSAVGIEMLGAKLAGMYGTGAFVYQFVSTLEEVGEMVGTALMIYTMLDYIGWSARSLQVSWVNAEVEPVAVKTVQRAVVREISRSQPVLRTDPWKVVR